MAIFHAEILYFEPADGRRHPAILIPVIVDTAELADFPADGHTFEKIIFENEIARIAAFGEKDIFVERVRAHMVAHDEVLHVFEGESFCGDGGQVFDPVGDGELFDGEILGHKWPPRNYNAGETK